MPSTGSRTGRRRRADVAAAVTRIHAEVTGAPVGPLPAADHGPGATG